MKLSAFADVCLRVMMFTGAENRESGAQALTTTQELADAIQVPYNHVAKAVLQLRKLGVLEVTRGRSGGTRISPDGMDTSVGAILRQLDTREDVVDCETTNHTCPLASRCRLRRALRDAREAFYATLDPLTVADLVDESRTFVPMPTIPEQK
ncbi:RrF2 family transcriptional regulator [Micrococcoides hystricis]|uniref:RrF2 family transcriptional regulator n=1 Tax=Micrococcoides hystricis TaxID=1572761 RepID=A0ABV6PA61_9MICC